MGYTHPDHRQGAKLEKSKAAEAEKKWGFPDFKNFIKAAMEKEQIIGGWRKHWRLRDWLADPHRSRSMHTSQGFAVGC